LPDSSFLQAFVSADPVNDVPEHQDPPIYSPLVDTRLAAILDAKLAAIRKWNVWMCNVLRISNADMVGIITKAIRGHVAYGQPMKNIHGVDELPQEFYDVANYAIFEEAEGRMDAATCRAILRHVAELLELLHKTTKAREERQ